MSTEFINDQWRLPNAFNGTESNVNKQSNYSMDFDSASSDYIDLGNITELNNLSAISTSSWFKTSNVLNAPIILNGGSSSTNRFYLQLLNSTTIRYVIGSSVENITVSNIADGNWHHISTVQNGTSLDIYLDGAKQNTSTITVVSPSTNIGDNFKIGRYFLSAANYFDGQIDAVSIYNYALTDGTGGTVNQIAALYGSSSTGIGNPMSLSPKPVAYYPLGDQDAFNGADYLVPNSSLKDYVFDFVPNDYIDLGNLQPSTTSLSISAWAYKTDATNASIIGRGASVDYGIFTYSGSLTFGLNSGSWSTIAISNFTSNYLNQWFHVCATWDGSTMKLYLNGNEEASTSKTGTITYTSNDTTIGKNSTLSGFEWDGKISNVQTYTTALPATGSNSVETLYNNGSPLTSMTGFTSLQGWWKLDASDTFDGTNWTIEDHAGSNDGTSSGMTQANLVQSDLSFTSGYSPYALDFDAASSDYIDCGDSDDFSFGNGVTDSPFSISAWVNIETATNGGIVSKFLTSTATKEWMFELKADRKLRFFLSDLYGQVTHASSSTALSLNTWYHVVATYDGRGGHNANLGMNIYINNFSESLVYATQNYNAMQNTNQPVEIGRYRGDRYLNGSISNVSIWNTELTSSQVSEIYSEGIPQNLNNHSAVSSLVSWWQLGSNSSFNTNWTVLDEKGSNNGTSVNMGEDAIVDGVGSYANGLSSGMGGDEVIGDAPYSTANALGVNMDVEDRVTDTPS